MSSAKLGFTYSSNYLNSSDIFPQVNFFQYRDFNSITKWLGIEIINHSPSDAKCGWEDIKNKLSNGEVPIIWGAGKIGNSEKYLPATFFAVHSYVPSNYTVQLTGVQYNGQISLSNLEYLRKEVENYKIPKFSWIELKLNTLPELSTNLMMQILTEKIRSQDESFLTAFSNFERDLNILKQLNPLFVKVILTNFSNQMYHPWGPVAYRKHFLYVISELNKNGYLPNKVLKKYEELYSEWQIIQMMFKKSTLTQTMEILKRIIPRINHISELEKQTFSMLLEQVEV